MTALGAPRTQASRRKEALRHDRWAWPPPPHSMLTGCRLRRSARRVNFVSRGKGAELRPSKQLRRKRGSEERGAGRTKEETMSSYRADAVAHTKCHRIHFGSRYTFSCASLQAFFVVGSNPAGRNIQRGPIKRA